MPISPNYILAFLEHRGLDYQHRTLREVWAFSDYEIEHTHDFIQWIFPTLEPSSNVIGSPKITACELELVCISNKATSSILHSAEWFTCFLERTGKWKQGYDHNHLRVTRMLKSLVLIGYRKKALELFKRLTNHEMNTEEINLSKTTLNFGKKLF